MMCLCGECGARYVCHRDTENTETTQRYKPGHSSVVDERLEEPKDFGYLKTHFMSLRFSGSRPAIT